MKTIKSEIKSAVENSEDPNIPRVVELINKGEAVSIKVCTVLKEGLSSMKQIVLDGEIHSYPDNDVRRKYAETILELIGERKMPELNIINQFNFTKEEKEEYDRLRSGLN